MKKRETRTWLLAGWLAAAVAGCDLVEYHPYDARVDGPTGLNEKNMARIEAACEGRDTVRFVMMGDTQRYYDETEAFVRHLNGREDVDFVIHGGDVADFGLTDEFLWVRDIMEGLRVPYVTLLGNHDMLGNGMAVFERVFGEENFTFMAGRNRFVCLNTNALEFDYSHPVPDFEFLYEVMADSAREVTRTVPVMHVAPGDVEFNNNVAVVFHEVLRRLPGVEFCVHAHNHVLREEDIFGDGVIYYGCSYMKDRNYLLFTLTPGGYTREVVYY